MGRNLKIVQPTDQVARFERLKDDYPEASYAHGSDGFFYGSFRNADEVLRSRSSLKHLIDDLLRRERDRPAQASGSSALSCDA